MRRAALRTNVRAGLLAELRAAAVALAGPPHRLTLSAIAESALRSYLPRLRAEYNGGEPFPPPAGELLSRTRECTAAERARGAVSNFRQRARALGVGDGQQITAAEWLAVVAASGGRCVYCNATGRRLSLDHVEPLSRGGRNTIDNAVPACRPCNSSKGTRLLLEWVMLREGVWERTRRKARPWRLAISLRTDPRTGRPVRPRKRW